VDAGAVGAAGAEGRVDARDEVDGGALRGIPLVTDREIPGLKMWREPTW
jgi:hypothetical protein